MMMHEGSKAELTPGDVERALREDLARADLALAAARPVLRHFLANDDPELFGDEIIARVRGMLRDLARQLAEAGGASAEDLLAERLSANAGLLAHAHALALEGQLLERLRHKSAIDPVLPPLIVELGGDRERGT